MPLPMSKIANCSKRFSDVHFFAPSHVEPVDDELHMLPEADVWESAALAGVLEHLVKIE